MRGDVLWRPPPNARDTSEIGRYLGWLRDERGLDFADYDALWRWSVRDLPAFWSSIWEFFDIRAHRGYDAVLGSRTMPGAQWFPGARLNYAEHLLGTDDDGERTAVLARSQTRDPIQLTFADLREQVARTRAGLVRLGVGPGDRVVAYLPNIPETLAAFIATASIGAVWAVCAPEFGARAVIDRFAQIEPTVLVTVAGYTYRDRDVDRRAEVASIRAGLPTLRHVVHVPYGPHHLPDTTAWADVIAEPGPLAFEPVPFDHPITVLFSSGTTGPPKAIVHGHGGLLVEHLKTMGLSWNLTAGSRLLWYTSTAWMMWNATVSALLVRASIVLVDGDPAWPDLTRLWHLAQETRPTFMGFSPAMLMACRSAGLQPGRLFDLSSIQVFGTAGSPLPPEGFRYVYDQLGPDVLLLNGSGGTDVCTGIVGGSLLQPVYEGEIAGRCLAVDAQAFDHDGNAVTAQLGELVITQPMPSMPVAFWNDHDGSRYRSSYFDQFPGIWRHGDSVVFTERGSCVIAGRSDATLNRGGVRLGTAEFYTAIEEYPEVRDSLIVHLDDHDGGAGQLILFVVPAPGVELDDDLRTLLARRLRAELSHRHVPDAIHAVPAIPYTRTGKKLEIPVKRILQGHPVDRVLSRDALTDPGTIDAFLAWAAADPAPDPEP